MKKILKDWVVPVVIAIILAVLINKFLVYKIQVPTESMDPTIKVGDQMFTTVVYNKGNIKRGDIIVFDSPKEDKLLVKRVVGLPGETVDIDDEGKVYINGQYLDEPYVKNKSNKKAHFEIPSDCYIFLGDNRANSEDARYWSNPYINKSSVKGKVQVRVYPFDRLGLVR